MTTIPFGQIQAPDEVQPTLGEINQQINKFRMSQADPRCAFDGKIDTDLPKPPYVELPAPRGFDRVANVDLNFLATSKDLVNLQKRANELADRERYESSWEGLTIRRAVRDAMEALLGIPADLFGNTKPVPLAELLTKNNRLRGVGILLAVASALMILANAVP